MAAYGLPNLNTEYLAAYETYLAQTLCVAANPEKIVPLITPHRREKGFAWSVAVERLYNEERIPRIYTLFEKATRVDGLLLRLRDISQRKNEVFSAISARRGRVLILSSSCKPTPELPDLVA